MNTAREHDAAQALQTGRIIFGAITSPLLMIAGVAYFLSVQGTVPFLEDPASLRRPLFYGWAALAVVLAFVAMKVWRGVVESGEEVAPPDVTRRLIIVAALVEMVGLTGVIAFMLTGHTGLLVSAVVIAGAGLIRYFPRAAWYGGARA